MSDNWRDGVRLHLEDFVNSFVVKGAKQSDVYDAIIEEISAIPILRKIFQEQRLKSHRTIGQELCADRRAIKRPGRNRTDLSNIALHTSASTSVVKSKTSDFGSRKRSRGALTSNAR
ncbi:hypothetical protein ACOJBM_02420 [Rhizobium beringeri]